MPILGTLISLALFLSLNLWNFLAAAIALAVGALIYFVSNSGAPIAPVSQHERTTDDIA